MQFVVDRLNALRRKLGLQDVPKGHSHAFGIEVPHNLHEALDECDKLLGIRTKHGTHKIYGLPDERPITQEYVGARLRRLERLFWLREAA